MSLWADYSFGRPDLAQLKANGVVGVLRYLSPDDQNTHGKILFAPERDQILNSGLDLALNFEWYQGRCLEGAAAGAADAAVALSQAKALGYPEGKTIYFSHDTGQYNWQAIDAYFSAVRAGLGGHYKLGAYGSASLVGQLHSANLIDKGWQTLAWSSGNRDPWAVIYQDGRQILGGSVDLDQVTSTDIGSWKDGPAPDWFEMTNIPADALAQIKAAVTEVLTYELPREVGLLRDGTTNAVFNPANAGALVDGLGIDGEIAQLKAAIDQLKLTASSGVDYQALALAVAPVLAAAVADEIYKRMAQ